MFRSGSIQLARLFGIRIGVDASWFLVLFFFIFLLSGSFRRTLDSSDTVAYLTAVASALLFFISLILHELGHALVARRLGIAIHGIDLWFFGGVAKMSRDTDSPGAEFKVAVAGPLVTLAVIVVCVAVGMGITGTKDFIEAGLLDSNADTTPALLLLSWLATINAALLLFNLVPAFPLDGGRIARALAWKITGERNRATRFAATLGQAFAYLLMGLGVAEIVLLDSFVGGLWLLVLGLFLAQAARGAVVQSQFSDRLSEVRVADIMDREPVSVPAGLLAARAHEDFFLRYRWPWFPVVDERGRFVGVVRQDPVEGAERSGDRSLLVRDVMERDPGDWGVAADEPLEALLGSPSLRSAGALMAVDGEGILRGVVTADQVRRALQAAVVAPGGRAG